MENAGWRLGLWAFPAEKLVPALYHQSQDSSVLPTSFLIGLGYLETNNTHTRVAEMI